MSLIRYFGQRRRVIASARLQQEPEFQRSDRALISRADEAEGVCWDLEAGRSSDLGLSAIQSGPSSPLCAWFGVETWRRASSKLEGAGWEQSRFGVLSATNADLQPARSIRSGSLAVGTISFWLCQSTFITTADDGQKKIGRMERKITIYGRVLGWETSHSTVRGRIWSTSIQRIKERWFT